jgi:polyribonucleotide nucleotidyltransferase
MPEILTLDLVVAGTSDAVLMVESEAKELSEDVMLGAVMFGHKSFQPVIDAIIKLAEAAPRSRATSNAAEDHSELEARHARHGEADLRAAYKNTDKQNATGHRCGQGQGESTSLPEGEEPRFTSEVHRRVFKSLQAKVVRGAILETKSRIDGRDLSTVRPIVSEVGILPRTHGSALFTRGETQAIVVATLGTGEDEQYVDSLKGPTRPPSCCTTTSRPSRSVRPAAPVRRAAAKSATASSPGAPSTR